ncbi:hypothetical protein MW290_21705 [Aquincola tertiaricarbonis]|uniref:Uncharacterized protein n=1 Tax=Aquincola tertiaricarbonis TaxID=391953 RepID=A0ABY4SKM9_AQUTE|nr:hypothetical protein [Aquincola tertiaricarbonis]URI11556.1 hypothetical protein MW290_21705 [Aquincola tertiaricarbonis]
MSAAARPPEGGAPPSRRDPAQREGADVLADAGPALHHWLLAVLTGAVFGLLAVLLVWIVLRALF